MQLLTIQEPGIDIVTNVTPTRYYTEWGEPYYDLALYLGWSKWIWCLKDLAAFKKNDYIGLYCRQCLWVLDVPLQHITWASLEGQCEGKEPSAFVFSHWSDIEALGENTMGLVKAPIKAD